MSWVNSIAKATNWLDSTLGTTGSISRTVLPAIGSAQTWYQSNVAGSFIEKVGKEAVSGFAAGQVSGSGYSVPLPEASSPNFRSSAKPGTFTASQAKAMGLENPRVRDAYAKIQNSNNPAIRSALDIVRPTIGKRGPTKSLSEAQIGNKKS